MFDTVRSLFLDIPPLAIPQGYRGLVPLIAFSFMALEYVAARAAGRHVHDPMETAASLGIALGNAVIRAVEVSIVALPFAVVYQHRLFDLPLSSVWAVLVLFFGVEFCFYLHHAAAHKIRWMWATHAVHHSTTHLNLTSGIRLGWTGALSGNFVFFLPMVWLGFHPFAVVGMLALSLAYQFFVHTELLPQLGPLEWVLNTPRHHQVHHSSAPAHLNKNYGGILIIYDRLFGTFAKRPEGEMRYGLARPLASHNPLWIAFHEWAAMVRDVWLARNWRDRWRAMFGAP